MFRRAVGSLLARRFSPRASPVMAPARSLHSLRDIPIGDVLENAAAFTVAAVAGAGGTFAVQNFKKGPGVDESAAGKMIGASEEVTDNKVITGEVKKLDMNERFEHWIKKNNKTYRDEEERAMRFQLFKDTVEWIESQPPSVQKRMFPEISFSADFTKQERRRLLAYPDGLNMTEDHEMMKSLKDKYEKGEPLKPAVKHGDTRATQVSA